jgi:hypothetical protein
MASIACTVPVAVHAVCLNDLGNVTNLRQFLIVSYHTGIHSKLACTVKMAVHAILALATFGNVTQLCMFLIVSCHTRCPWQVLHVL